MTDIEKLKAEFPVGTEVYSVYGDTAHIIESWEPDDSGVVCVRTFSDGESETTFYSIQALFENRLIPYSQPDKIRLAQRLHFGKAWDD